MPKSQDMQQPEVENNPDEPRAASENTAEPYHREQKKIGRNDPCYCGSGKKFKQCHGKLV